jgi:hypothetical protein
VVLICEEALLAIARGLFLYGRYITRWGMRAENRTGNPQGRYTHATHYAACIRQIRIVWEIYLNVGYDSAPLRQEPTSCLRKSTPRSDSTPSKGHALITPAE